MLLHLPPGSKLTHRDMGPVRALFGLMFPTEELILARSRSGCSRLMKMIAQKLRKY